MTGDSFISYCHFPTAIGPIGIAWSHQGVVRVQLPESTIKTTIQRLIGDFEQAKKAEPNNLWIMDAIHRIQEHLLGKLQDFGHIPLDLRAATPFFKRVYSAAQTIPAGQVKTYGELAIQIHAPGAARAVGTALGKNPVALLVPCHRIVSAGGKLGGFSAFGGLTTKKRLLLIEGCANDQFMHLH
ncbi:MAG: methylated-DNA--[protein]-cysteine S-methyltransferase [Bdellovibrionaceae bacterium]|nr:methylated-DNA--[protein]-cysteine S-methyltransferase [Pseudobdellovibrionaceae bacterium]